MAPASCLWQPLPASSNSPPNPLKRAKGLRDLRSRLPLQKNWWRRRPAGAYALEAPALLYRAGVYLAERGAKLEVTFLLVPYPSQTAPSAPSRLKNT